jgi:hypothetical protein
VVTSPSFCPITSQTIPDMRDHSSGGISRVPPMVTSEWRDGTTMLIGERISASVSAHSIWAVISLRDRRMIFRLASILSSADDLCLATVSPRSSCRKSLLPHPSSHLPSCKVVAGCAS